MEHDHIGPRGQEFPRQSAGFLRALGRLVHAEGRLHARDSAGLEMPHARECARTANLAVVDGLAMGQREFFALSDVNTGGDALVEHQFAVEPEIIELRIP